jgi:hypothetical protein
VEFPFGFVTVAMGKKSVQEGWLGADDVLELEFEVGSREAVPKKKWFGLW